MAEVELQTVGPDQLAGVRALFDAGRTTRHCWCMAFCTSRWDFATGWYGGGNRRRFEALAVAGPAPMGVLASVGGDPVGWCACGPRARYTAALTGRSSPLAGRPRAEDDLAWLVACTFIRPGHRGAGLAVPLLRAAVSLAREAGAPAIEAWPLATGVRRPGDEHLGREGVFARLGFRCVDRPSADRAIMRRDLTDEARPLLH